MGHPGTAMDSPVLTAVPPVVRHSRDVFLRDESVSRSLARRRPARRGSPHTPASFAVGAIVAIAAMSLLSRM